MNFNFQQMKPVILREFDHILEHYPTDLSHIRNLVPTGGDPYERKRIIVREAAENCPVHIFPHYPFAFEIDVGEARHVCYVGIGNLCRDRSGVDFSPIHRFRQLLSSCNLGSFNDYTDHIHRTLDHEKLLAVGFSGVYEECARLNKTEEDEDKRRYRELVMDCCLAVKKIGLRLKEKARSLSDDGDEDVRHNLTRIAESVNTPWDPPVTFFDALNTILCTTLFISGLDGVEMNAYGQLDLLLDPFYRRDLESGLLPKEEAYFLIQCFLHKTDLHCHFNDVRKTYDNGVSVMIGGCDPSGVPVYNAVTDLILDAYTDNKLINPKLNARASASSPRAYIERLAALMRTGNNNLIVENDDYIVPMFQRMGLSNQDARTYVGNGCQEVICRNQLHSRAFVYLNMVQVLLDTLTYGSVEELPENRRIVYRHGCFDKSCFFALQYSFLANLRSVIRVLAEEFSPFETLHSTICPEPMLSAFTADCIGSGRDLADGGARYQHKTLSMVGFGTLCDSLLNLRQAYDSGTFSTVTEAVLGNFENSEPLRLQLKNAPHRFGHSEEGDAYAAELAGLLANVSRGIFNAHGIEWRTSLFTYYQFKPFGQTTGATPDGRKAGESFSRQMNMASIPDLTTAARSMSVLTKAEFNDVGMFDIALPCTVTDSDEAHQALTDYIRTCLALKLPVLQPNTADRKTMEEERRKKGTHPDLIVRVCGYSAVFGQLSPDMQDEIIARTME